MTVLGEVATALKPSNSNLRLRLGKVYSVDTTNNVCEIKVAGDEVSQFGVAFLSSFWPWVGATVHVLEEAGARLILGSGAAEPWRIVGASGQPAFAGSWVNLGSPETARFRRIGKEVFLSGTIKDGTLTSAAFVLPTGYRPYGQKYFSVVSNNNTLASLRVLSNGDVIPMTGDVTWIDLGGLSFSVD